MKKLKLNLDEIKVESFETGINTNSKGTIHGQLPEITSWSDCECITATCPPTINCTTLTDTITNPGWTCGNCTLYCPTNECPPYSELHNCSMNYIC